jgi:hypothetical protein
MKSLLSSVVLATALCIGGGGAKAALVSVDLVAGSGDGQITRDTERGLEWLDHDAGSLGRSHADVSSNFGLGGDFEGFRYATRDEVEALIVEAGLPAENGPMPSMYAGALAFIELVGGTIHSPGDASLLGVMEYTRLGDYFLKGVVAEPSPIGDPTGHTYITCCVAPDATGFGLGDPPALFSSWLVRPVPEPAIAGLLVAALVVIGVTRLRFVIESPVRRDLE